MSIKSNIAKSILMGLTLQSCACGLRDRLDDRSPSNHRPAFELGQLKIDSRLLANTMEFIRELDKRNKDYTLDFKEINLVEEIKEQEPNVVGVCFYFNRIDILNKNFSETKKKLILFHELGHCVLKLEHDPENSNSIMQPVLMQDDYYINNNWDKLVDDMIKSTNKIKFELYNERKFDYVQ